MVIILAFPLKIIETLVNIWQLSQLYYANFRELKNLPNDLNLIQVPGNFCTTNMNIHGIVMLSDSSKVLFNACRKHKILYLVENFSCMNY